MTLRKVYKKIRKVIIYEIVCNITGERYIGSTILSMNHRLIGHIKKQNCVSRQIINRGNYEVNELETFNTRFELAKLLKEQYYLDNNTNINNLRAFGIDIQRQQNSLKKYREGRKEITKKNWSIYYQQNRQILDKKNGEIKRNRISIKCPCGGRYKSHFKNYHFTTKRHILFSVMEEMIATLENNFSTIGK